MLKNYPESVRRIVIVDWDIHHGNGTQKHFIMIQEFYIFLCIDLRMENFIQGQNMVI